MNKVTGGITAVVVAVLVVVGAFVVMDDNEANTPTQTNQQTEQMQTQDEQIASTDDQTNEEQADAVVTYSDDGFSPETTGPIEVGDTVRFENESSQSMWVASNQHPSHTENPDFDQLGSVPQGESWTYTFRTAGEHGFHNHLAPSDGGVIVVQ